MTERAGTMTPTEAAASALMAELQNNGLAVLPQDKLGTAAVLIRDAIDAAVAAQTDRLRSLLRRIDDVTAWETTPLGRGFQEEIEAALR
jgi:hypothetical protein